jgi:diaminopimelate epimerase
MNYTLYSGAGNTFALLEEPLLSDEAVRICEECDVDGVIFSENTYRMRIFNRDGSEAEMCGNGLRCFVKFLMEKKIHQDFYFIETLAGVHKAWVNGSQVCVEFPPPKDLKWNLKIGAHTLHHLNTGVPHAVIFVDSIEAIDLPEIAPPIRHNPLFPEGVNVNFVEALSLRMRTYERGVERETLACGTGAVASALAASKIFSLSSPLTMEVGSGEKLKISFPPDWGYAALEGPANRIGEGTFRLKEQSRIISSL